MAQIVEGSKHNQQMKLKNHFRPNAQRLLDPRKETSSPGRKIPRVS